MATNKDTAQDTPNANPTLASALTAAAAAAAQPGVSTKPDPNARKEIAGGPLFGTDNPELLAASQSFDGSLTTFPVYLVECKSGLDWVPIQAFEFEIPFLERKFPEGVKIKSGTGGYVDVAEDAEPFAELDLKDDAVLIFEQMRTKHNTPRHQGLVEEVTGGVAAFAEATGLAYNRRTKLADQGRSLIKQAKPVTKGKPAKKAAKR